MARRDETANGITQRDKVRTDVWVSEQGTLVDQSGNPVGSGGTAQAGVSADAGNALTLGSDFKAFLDETSLTAANVLSTDLGNALVLGDDNKLYLDQTLIAAGGISADAGNILTLGSDDKALLLGVARLNQANVFTKAQNVAVVPLTDAATINTDASASNHFTVTLGGNRTLANPTNLPAAAVILNWVFIQDGTGSRGLTYGSKFKHVGGTVPTPSTSPGAIDMMSGLYLPAQDIILCTFLKGFA